MIPNPSFYQHRSVYRDVPIEDYQNAFATSAKKYDTNLDEYNVLNALASNIKALPKDQAYLQQKLKAADQAIAEVADPLTGNNRWDLAGSALQRMKASFTADPKLNAAKESYLNFAKGEEDKQAMRMKGQTPFEVTNPEDHQSIDENGNVNIYRPEIQVKADYVKQAQDLMAQVAPDIVSMGLQPSEVAGILEGKVIRGIDRNKIMASLDSAKRLYDESAEGVQHRQYLGKYAPDRNPDEFINNLLLSAGMLRTFREERVERTGDPSFAEESKARLLEQQIQGRLAVKQAKGSKEYDPEVDGLIGVQSFMSRDSGELDAKTGKNKMIKSNAFMIKNAEIVKDYSDTFFAGDGSRIKPIDKRLSYNPEKHSILNHRIKGFASDDVNGPGTMGSAIAEIKYIDHDDKDKEKTMNVMIQSPDDSFVNIFKSYKDITTAVNKHNKGDLAGGKGHSMIDSSGLLGYPDAVAFYIGTDNVVRPQIKRKEGGWRLLKDYELAPLGLKDHYTTKDIEELTANAVARTLKPYVRTSKEIQATP